MKHVCTSLLPAAFLLLSVPALQARGIFPESQRQPAPGVIRSMAGSGQMLRFLENKGQVTDQHGRARTDIGFKLETPGLNIFIGSGRLTYQWASPRPASGNDADGAVTADMYRMDVSLVGADPQAAAVREELLPEFRQYLSHGQGQAIRAYACRKIIYKNIYPFIDWELYIREDPAHGGQHFEYDFVVRPGGKVSDIRMAYDGAVSLKRNRDGSVTATTPAGTVTQQAPRSFEADGRRVASGFVLDEGKQQLCFRTAPYKGMLIIDPVIKWGTYYGVSSGLTTKDTEYGFGVACDKNGYVYMAGQTSTTSDIATTGAHQTVYNGYLDAFLVKFDCSGFPVWGTYYGGGTTKFTYGQAVTCDPDDNVYLAGYTNSPDSIGTAGSHQPALSGGYDAFLVKFDKDGVRQWGTYYGGTGEEQGATVACDRYGHVYLGGNTTSAADIATAGSQQDVYGGAGPDNFGDGFLAQFTSDGVLQWGTYYGGDGDEQVNSVTCDGDGNVYITGATHSSAGISTPGSFRQALTGTAGGKPPVIPSDAFLVKFDSSGQRKWGTYYGGDKAEQGCALTMDRWGHLYLAGYTDGSPGLATPGRYQTGWKNQEDAFLTKFDTAGNHIWSTYYGDSAADFGYAVACDLRGNVYLFGQTTNYSTVRSSFDTLLATPGAHQRQHGGLIDVFLASFDSSGVTRQWGTYYGGTGFDNVAPGLGTADGWGNVFVTGCTGSMNAISTPGSYKPTGGLPAAASGSDAFLACFHDSCALLAPPVMVTGNDTVCGKSSQVYEVPEICGITTYAWALPQGWSGSSNGSSISVTTGAVSGPQILRVAAVNRCGDTGLVQTFTAYVRQFYPASITANDYKLSVSGNEHYVAWQWYRNGSLIQGATDSTYEVDTNAVYSVKVTDQNGCMDSTSYPVTNVSVAETGHAAAVRVFPNPARSVVYITAPFTVHAVITGLDGKVVLRQDDAREMDISRLSAGLYLIRITDSSGQVVRIEKMEKLAGTGR